MLVGNEHHVSRVAACTFLWDMISTPALLPLSLSETFPALAVQ